ncbi:MAG: rRNA maturation RNase YbeY [Bacteroidetes bacterium]|nr:rRNA maturation RNase YbeY [Bacteroidota bacterium]
MNFYSENNSFSLQHTNSIKDWIRKVIAQYNKRCGEITFIFLSDQDIRKMNHDYLNHDFPTDVITFDYSEDEVISGDIFVGYETVQVNSQIYGVAFKHEMHRVLIHGILHLIGFNDDTSHLKNEMHQKENDALSLFV